MIPFWAIMLAKAAVKSIQEQSAKDRAKQAEQVAKEQAEQLRIKRAEYCCASCTTVVAVGVSFCHACGSDKITTRGVILDLQAREMQLANEIAAREEAVEQDRIERERTATKHRIDRERKERERHVAARQRCREVLAWRYCEPCHTAFDPSHRFCTSCGVATEDFPRRYAFEHASRDYPDLIKHQTDFDALV